MPFLNVSTSFQANECGKRLHIKHLQFLSWPNYGVPEEVTSIGNNSWISTLFKFIILFSCSKIKFDIYILRIFWFIAANFLKHVHELATINSTGRYFNYDHYVLNSNLDIPIFLLKSILTTNISADRKPQFIVHCSGGVGRSGTFLAAFHTFSKLTGNCKLQSWSI